MYLVVEIIRRRRGIDCNATGLGVVYATIFFVLSFREITLFGLGYLIFAIAFVLISLYCSTTHKPARDQPTAALTLVM